MELGFDKAKAPSQKHQMMQHPKPHQEQRNKNRGPDMLHQIDQHPGRNDSSLLQCQDRPLRTCSSVLRTEGLQSNIQKNQTQVAQDKINECELSFQNGTAAKSIQEEMKNMDSSFIKMSVEKSELEQNLRVAEQDLCHYKNQVREYQNKMHNILLKYQEEINNRQAIESKVEYITSVNQIVEQHFQEISQTLSTYGEINTQHREFNSKVENEVQDLKRQYEEVFSKFKEKIENLTSEVSVQVTKRAEEAEEARKIRTMLEQKINECNAKLCAEYDKISSLEKDLVQSQLLVKEKIHENEVEKKNSDEKISQLLKAFEKLELETQSLKNENLAMKNAVYLSEDLQNKLEKISEDYQALRGNFETVSGKLSLLNEENEVQRNTLKELTLEKENKIRRINILEEQCLELSMKIKEGVSAKDTLSDEIKEWEKKVQTLSEGMLQYKERSESLASEVERLILKDQDGKSASDGLKQENCQLQEKIEILSMQLEEKNRSLMVTKEEHQQLISRLKDVELCNNQMQDEIYSNENTIKDLKERIEMRENEFDKECDKMKKEAEKVKEDALKQNKDLIKNLDAFKQQCDNRSKVLEEEKNKLAQDNKSLQTENEDLRSTKSEQLQEINNLKHLLKTAQFEKEKLERSCQNLESDIEREQRKTKKKDAGQKEQITDLQNAVSTLEKTKWKLQTKVDQMERELNAANLTKLNNDDLLAKIERLEDEKRELNEKLNEKLNKENSALSGESSRPPGIMQKPGPPPALRPMPKKRVSFEDDGMTSDSSVDIPTFFHDKLKNFPPAKRGPSARTPQPASERQKRKLVSFQADTTSSESRALEASKRSFKKSSQSDMLDSI